MDNNITKLLNNNLSDLHLMYVKLHNYHWNVKGIMFKSVHDLTESYYDYFADQYDSVAERIIQLGGKPFISMKDYMNNTALPEEYGHEFDGKTILSLILNDFELLLKKYREISKSAAEANDGTTVMLADDNIKWLEKQIWFTKATLA